MFPSGETRHDAEEIRHSQCEQEPDEQEHGLPPGEGELKVALRFRHAASLRSHAEKSKLISRSRTRVDPSRRLLQVVVPRRYELASLVRNKRLQQFDRQREK